MEPKEALDILTDWFHAYTDTEGRRIHEHYITDKNDEAKKCLRDLFEKEEAQVVDITVGNKKTYMCDKCGSFWIQVAGNFANGKELNPFCPGCGRKIKMTPDGNFYILRQITPNREDLWN